ncbi:MAG: DEAD/DEAH box helicase, partial [Bacteroidota bacterium]
DKRTWLFSATMPAEIARIAREYLYSPEKIRVGKLNQGAENVEHEYYIHPKKGRYGFLRDLLREYGMIYGIVFCRTKRKTREVARRLKRDGFKAEALHGDMSQPARDKVMVRFRAARTKILVATDVAARGVDIDSLTHVINFNLSDEDAVYIHRSGRTGRAGSRGVSVAILDDEEKGRIRGLEKVARKSFKLRRLGDGYVRPDAPAPKKEERKQPEPRREKAERVEKVERDTKGEQRETKKIKPPTREEKAAIEASQKSARKDAEPYAKTIFNRLDQIMETNITEDPYLEYYMPSIVDYMGEYSKDQLIQHFVAWLNKHPNAGKSASANGNSEGGKRQNQRNGQRGQGNSSRRRPNRRR